jgi:hypothetical protein
MLASLNGRAVITQSNKNLDGTHKTAVPRHSEIKPNMVRKICKDVDIPVPEEK